MLILFYNTIIPSSAPVLYRSIAFNLNIFYQTFLTCGWQTTHSLRNKSSKDSPSLPPSFQKGNLRADCKPNGAVVCPYFPFFLGNLGPYFTTWLCMSSIMHEGRLTVLCLANKHSLAVNTMPGKILANFSRTSLAFMGASSLLHLCSSLIKWR